MILYQSKIFQLHLDLASISSAICQIDSLLTNWKIKPANRLQAKITLEEWLIRISESETKDIPVSIRVVKSYQKAYFRISYQGNPIGNDFNNTELDNALNGSCFDVEAESVVRNLFLRATSKRVETKSAKGITKVRILVEDNDNAMAINTLIAMAMAVVIGVALRSVLPHDMFRQVAGIAFQPFYTIFIRGIQLVMAPLVFFSIVSSIMGYSDFGALGRSGAKLIGGFLLTTLLAALLAFGVDAILCPGSSGSITLPSSQSLDGNLSDVNTSLLETLINVVPDNFLGVFIKSDMLQLIFLAILTGTAVARLGKYSEKMKECIEMLDSFFGSITATITKILPLAVFGAIGNLVMTINIEDVVPVAAWVGTLLVCFVAMFLLYALLLMVVLRASPVHFFRHYSRAIITSVSTASSCGTIPDALKCCQRMGISPRIYSFSIPLGATTNMHGSCMLLATATLFLASVFGITVDFDFYVTLTIGVLILSLATPGVPGAIQASVLILLHTTGIPDAGYLLIVGLVTLLDNFVTCVNVTGTGFVTALVAQNEHLFDKAKYQNSMSN